MSTPAGRVAAINRYPVKSMQGEQLSEVLLDQLGIAGDRRLALRDLTTGKIVSAKIPKVGIPLLSCRATTDDDGSVVLSVDGQTFSPTDADAALSELLGRPVRVEAATGAEEVFESEWPEIDGLALSGVTTDLPIAMGTVKGTFTDLAALHVLTTSSVARLGALAPGSRITDDRFRPSLLIETTGDGFVENDWVDRAASLGSARLAFGSASPRCIMTTLPQGELDRDPAILRTIAEHNRKDFGGFGEFACLGVYAEVTTPGLVRVGDDLILDD
jgi:uncharacterized protein